jgi:hypothetical protein
MTVLPPDDATEVWDRFADTGAAHSDQTPPRGTCAHTRAFERALELPPWPASSLHIAAWHGDFEQVRRLVERGADLTAQAEGSDETALDWAVNASRLAPKPTHDDVIAYLRSVMKNAGQG